MPLYAYRCNDCEHEFEIRQRMSEDPLTDCPSCDGTIRRVINKVGVVFKGSGFYVTDNKGKNPAAPSTPDNGSEAPSKNGSEAPKSESPAEPVKAETKPAESKKAEATTAA